MKSKKIKSYTDERDKLHFQIPSKYVWNLDSTLASFIRDSLAELVEHTNAVPTFVCSMYPDKNTEELIDAWKQMLKDVADFFDYYVEHQWTTSDMKEEELLNDYVNKAFDILKTCFRNLWY